MWTEYARLDWIPKPFGPGDLDGDGWLKLLGKPDIDMASMLVRETAQNSWDARDRDRIPLFEMHLRTISGPDARLLREHIFLGAGAGLRRDRLLDVGTTRVLEISDRRTHGLRGPVRNDRPIAHGTPTDFIDLVLGVGAPPDDPRGGGSYGFGKVVTYMTSSVGTILIWSRTDTGHGIEDRLVGSAVGRSFERDGVRYTGRHWWGVKTDVSQGGPVQPLLGEPAAELASKVFSRGFEPGETGTSLMIIDPQLGDAADDQGLVEIWREAILRNLWSKLMADAPSERRMEVHLRHEGEEVDLRGSADGRLKAYESCLSAVRSVQAGKASVSPLVRVEEVHCLRPRKLVGHIALTRYVKPVGVDDDLTHHVCLMRNEAELVVKYVAHPQATDGVTAWAGVFKPTSEVDAIYARSEPPAHDDWVPKSMPERTDRTLVNTCFTKTSDIVKDYLTPRAGPVDASGQVSAGDLSFALASLAGTAIGSRPVPLPKPVPTRGPGRPRKMNKVRVQSAIPVEGGDTQSGAQLFHVLLVTEGHGVLEIAPSRLAWAVEGGREQDPEGRFGAPPAILRWIVQPGTLASHVTYGGTVSVQAGDSVTAEVLGSRGRALEVDFTLIGSES